ncbi:ATP phosphoribosyltransferase regulatory subunit [Nocardia cyriacigeorgica]|uniref:ATP phosphoribosyltransferase regulatory subunit n=1 Tax=Nocardia cyriacigeorgica TaxID=135487 RepID=UPI00189402A5|nr:ATP phosphoribosyltransferase regulatory subunit [Nocardia cyriacigeorgica]MBF6397894.1 ATP phosphoribosyltransferase regulatory subunit [Nocardia cyriacigeorgica]MBF6402449.1 ATP phosphoribosyltransferase regulatory subunit [Nocardia cyriacigeorgica]
MSLPRGFTDAGPDRTAALRHLERRWFDSCALWGFQPVRMPPAGFADTFTTGHHATGDRIYRFPDRKGRDLALVSDSLPAALRLAGNRNHPEQRLSYSCPIFRYERKPRRHFHHLGLMEVSRTHSTVPDQIRPIRRMIEIVTTFLGSDVSAEFTIANPGIWHEIAELFIPPAKVTGYLDILRRMPTVERHHRLRADGAPDAALAAARAMTSRTEPDHASEIPASITTKMRTSRELAGSLNRIGIRATTDLNELHASEFHDGVAYVVRHGGSVIGDGGSYGRFATNFLGYPSVTYASVLGLEKVADLAGAHVHTGPAADVAILSFPDPEPSELAEQLANSLRVRGISAWEGVVSRSIRRHLRNISELHIPLTILIGREEVLSPNYRIRENSGEIFYVPKSGVVEWVERWVRRCDEAADKPGFRSRRR